MALLIHPTRAVTLLTVVTTALIAGAVGVFLVKMRASDLEHARIETASLAHMFREQADRSFDSADQVLRAVQERMQTPFGARLPLAGPQVHLLLGARVLGAPDVDLVAVTDDSGRVVNASRDDAEMADSLAQSELFRKVSRSTADEPSIGHAVREKDGNWTVDMARGFTDGAGRFRGMVILTMKMPRFDPLIGWLHLDEPPPMSLYLLDGTLLASMPPRDSLMGDRAPELGSDSLAGVGTVVQTVAHVSGDGERHAYAVARVGPYPLVVSVTADDARVLASWREKAASMVLGAGLVCLFIVAAAALLVRELEREARLSQALRDARDRYHQTVDSLMDAIVGVDGSHRVILFNPAAERMFGLPAAEALGMPLQQLIPEGARGTHGHHVEKFMAAPSGPRAMSNLDVIGVRRDGTSFPIESTISRTVVDGEPQVTAVLRDVTDRRRAQEELEEMNRQLRALSAALQDVREQERGRISRELHDELGQQLTGLKLELSWLGNRLRAGNADAAQELDKMRHRLDTAIGSVRRISSELRPRLLDDLGFGAALAWQTSEFASRTGLEVELDVPAADCVTDEATATALFRIVQESLTNVVRHAGARTVEIRLVETDAGLVLTIRDDGNGRAPPPAKRGLGLVSMRERATALGGSLRVASRPGEGTTIEVRVPLMRMEQGEPA